EPELSACAKMVGLEVTPTTCQSRIRSARFPVASRSRLMSSSHTDTPAADSCSRMSSDCGFMACRSLSIPALSASVALRKLGNPGQAAACRGRHPPRREPELLEQHLIVGRGTEVFQADTFPGIAGKCPPALGNARFDADPGPDPRREHLLLVGSLLRGEPFHARHRNDPGGDPPPCGPVAGPQRHLHLAASCH